MSWESISLSDALRPLKSSPFTRDELNYSGGQYQSVHYGDILVRFPSVVDAEKEGLPYVSESVEGRCSRCSLLQNGDIIIADTAEDEAVGKAIEIQGIKGQKVVSGLHTMAFRPQEGVFAPGFLGYFLNSSVYHNQLLPLMQGIKVLSISKTAIRDTVIKYPSYKEQEKIVASLSGVDDIIGALDEAIAKKKQIKEGLMQQLLTGKTRLPGFTDDWVELRFEDFISRFATGLNPRSNFVLNDNASNYYITIKDFVDGVIYFDHCDKVSDEAIKRINERSDLRKGDVLFSSIGRVGDAYVIEETPTNWNINESVFSLRPNPNIIDSHFLYYLIKSQDAQSKFQESITGTTLKSIKMGHLKEISCCFPSIIDEQKEIASTIRSIDREILSIETLRKKYRLIKQGMMQELLTGKTRL